MANTDESISRLVDKMLSGEIVLPDIQRDYVWKGTQIPRFLDSLNQGWPIGSVLLWDTTLDVPTKVAAVLQESGTSTRPTILLDGQQRLTTLARIFAPDRTPQGEKPLDVRYNPIVGEFRNANAIQRRDPAWIPVSRFLSERAQYREVVQNAGIAASQTEEDGYTDQLSDVARNIRGYRLPIQTIREDDYEQVAEIFNRVNTGGRRLSKGDLVMGSLAARWPGGRNRIEEFEQELASIGWQFNREVLLRIMSTIAKGNANHIRLVELREAQEWEHYWKLTETAVQHSVQFLISDCDVPNVRLLPTEYLAIVPAAVMHKRQGRGVLKPGEAEALRRWVFVAGAFAHYSGSTETTLGVDLNLVESSPDGLAEDGLLKEAPSPRSLGSKITAEDLKGRTIRSPFLRLLQLRAIQNHAHSWWSHRALNYGSANPDLAVEIHHVFPKAWLRKNGLGTHPERDTIANFAFLSKYDNIKISDSNPVEYLANAEPEELKAQWVPHDPDLWKAERFTEFCTQRRELLATALNDMLGLTSDADPEVLELPEELDHPERGAWAEEEGVEGNTFA